jgi:peptide/nickel transport system permease protein
MAGLLRYIIKRLIQGGVTILVVTIIIFFLFVASGNPINQLRANPTLTPAQYQYYVELFGLDQPWWVQLGRYLGNMFTFNFGPALSQGREVSAILGEALPRTLFLFGSALLIEYLIGILVGRYIAWKRGRVTEGLAILTSLTFYNMPSFWIGLILLYFFAYLTPAFPLQGPTGPNFVIQHYPWAGPPGTVLFDLVDYVSHAFLPMIALVLISTAGTILLMQTSMLEVLGEDFILTARAKGLSERAVRKRHAGRNAYLPIVTSLSISLGFVVGGAIILESIFTYRGLGTYLLIGILSHDQFLAGAVLFLISILVISGNIVADILYGVLDPRVRL